MPKRMTYETNPQYQHFLALLDTQGIHLYHDLPKPVRNKMGRELMPMRVHGGPKHGQSIIIWTFADGGFDVYLPDGCVGLDVVMNWITQ